MTNKNLQKKDLPKVQVALAVSYLVGSIRDEAQEYRETCYRLFYKTVKQIAQETGIPLGEAAFACMKMAILCHEDFRDDA